MGLRAWHTHIPIISPVVRGSAWQCFACLRLSRSAYCSMSLFSALDEHVKRSMESELMEMLTDFHNPVIFVSHNRDEVSPCRAVGEGVVLVAALSRPGGGGRGGGIGGVLRVGGVVPAPQRGFFIRPFFLGRHSGDDNLSYLNGGMGGIVRFAWRGMG